MTAFTFGVPANWSSESTLLKKASPAFPPRTAASRADSCGTISTRSSETPTLSADRYSGFAAKIQWRSCLCSRTVKGPVPSIFFPMSREPSSISFIGRMAAGVFESAERNGP